ncbi:MULTISPECIES: AAA family ATPase [unclassified Microbacterium]|uniref:AAA family ATPase n=1 Tax=unclassified Microbacterium TaxID=2609290 RepID=UPI0012F9C36D|nr:AAA family ATPase [Microbacterium sp. MAH-37]
MPDRLVVLNGMAGAGKTSLAGPLAAVLGFPLVSKDAIKEALGDAVDAPLPTRAIGALAADALWRIVGMLEGTVLVESVWLAGRDEEWFRRGWESVGSPVGIEVWCEAPRDVMRERYLTRPRHAVHDDQARIDEWEAAVDAARPMTGFPVVEVDTSAPVDVADLARRIRVAQPGVAHPARMSG